MGPFRKIDLNLEFFKDLVRQPLWRITVFRNICRQISIEIPQLIKEIAQWINLLHWNRMVTGSKRIFCYLVGLSTMVDTMYRQSCYGYERLTPSIASYPIWCILHCLVQCFKETIIFNRKERPLAYCDLEKEVKRLENTSGIFVFNLL